VLVDGTVAFDGPAEDDAIAQYRAALE